MIGESLFNSATLNFFKSGKYRFWLPFIANVVYEDDGATRSNDFIGLNYYSHFTISAFHVLTEPDNEQKLQAPSSRSFIFDDLNHPLYAEGLYRALAQIGELGMPVYVAENGVSDAVDDRWVVHLKVHHSQGIQLYII